MTDGAAANAAQHIGAPFVAGLHAVGDGKTAGADVVGDHLQRRRLRIHVFGAGFFHGALGGGHDVLEEVDVVVGGHVLQNGRKTFQAHPRIDVGPRQAVQLTGRVAVELREDEVPNFHVAVAVFVGAPRRAALNLRAAVVEDFRARTARAGVAHHPEVVRHVAGALVVADADDAFFGNVDFILPNVVGFVVFKVNGNPKAVFGQLINRRQEFPGPVNGFTLEVITEAEVSQHFKERVVTRGITHVVQVVVLAARADALLSRRRTVKRLIEPQEVRLELVHASVRKEKRRIVLRYHWARLYDRVALALKEFEVGRTNFGRRHVGTGFHKLQNFRLM